MAKRKPPEKTEQVERGAEPMEIREEDTAEETFETPAELRRDAVRERTETALGIEKAKEIIEKHRKKSKKPTSSKNERLGDFADQVNEEGGITLTPEQMPVVQKFLEKIKTEDRFSPPSLAIGGKIATEYESRARNFSTRTRILELPDGRKVFVINNYPLSGIHRELDALGKWTAGAPMRKAKHRDWKKAFAEKSKIPIIECDDPNIVLVPYIQNINADDVFTFNHEIKNFGEMPQVAGYGTEEKLELADKIVDELAKTHTGGIAWGEAILANMIIAKDGQPIIVDPEIRYNKDVPLTEQKARDLLDFIQSLVSALRRSEKDVDINAIVQRIIDHYPDAAVKSELPGIIKDKSRWIRKLLRPIHELPRLGQNSKDYEAVLNALREK